MNVKNGDFDKFQVDTLIHNFGSENNITITDKNDKKNTIVPVFSFDLHNQIEKSYKDKYEFPEELKDVFDLKFTSKARISIKNMTNFNKYI